MAPKSGKKIIAAGILASLFTGLALLPGRLPQANAQFGLTGGGGQQGAQALQRRRQQDQQECQAQTGPLGGILNQVGSVQDIVSQGIQQTLPATLSEVFQQRIPDIINKALTEQLPRVIENGLQNELPRLIEGQIIGMINGGAGEAEIRSALPNLFRDGITQLLPRIIQNGLPQALQGGLAADLPAELVSRLQAQLPGILASSELPDRINDLMASTTDALPPEFRQRLASGSITAAEAAMLESITRVGQESLNQSGAITAMAGDLARNLTDRILPMIMSQITSRVSGAAGGYLGGSNFPQTINGLVSGIPILDQLDIEGNILRPMVNEITPALTNSVRLEMARAGIGPLPFDPSRGFAPQDLVGYGTPGFDQLIGREVSADVVGSAGQIGQNAANQLNFNNLGTNLVNSLKSGLASGLAGGVGGLVAGIPYVGPILAPLVENVMLGALEQLLGIPGLTGFPVSDLGTHAGVQQTNRELNDIIGNTEESNRNEQRLNQLTEEHKSLTQQACTHVKSIRRVLLFLEEKEFVYDRDTRKKAALEIKNAEEGFQKFFASGFAVSPGNEGVQNTSGPGGQPLLTTNLAADIADARREAAAALIDDVAKSGNIHKEEVADALAQQASPDFNRDTESTMSKADYEELKNPKNLGNARFWTLKLKAADLRNRPSGQFLLAYDELQGRQATAERETELAYLAGEGFKPVRTCAEWRTVPRFGGVYCARWTTLTPGATVKTYREKLLTSWLDQLIQAKEMGEEFVAEFMRTAEQMLTDLGGQQEQTANVAPPSRDPCPSPEPCPETGWQPEAPDPAVFDNALQNISPATQLGTTLGGVSLGDRLLEILTDGLDDALNQVVESGFGLAQNSMDNLFNSLLTDIPNQITSVDQIASGFRLQTSISLILDEAIQRDSAISENDRPRLIAILLPLLVDLITSVLINR